MRAALQPARQARPAVGQTHRVPPPPRNAPAPHPRGCLQAFLNAWLTFWTSDKVGWIAAGKPNLYLLVYACLFFGNSTMTYVRSLVFYAFTTRAARTLHERMLGRVMRFPASFFDVTPSGRILNRFSKARARRRGGGVRLRAGR